MYQSQHQRIHLQNVRASDRVNVRVRLVGEEGKGGGCSAT